MAEKNIAWGYSPLQKTLTATFPSGREVLFHLGSRVNGMSFSDELMYQYGVRQWLASNSSAIKTSNEEEKIAKMRMDFNDFLTSGLELSESGGQIRIRGRERANASANAETKRAVKELTSTAVSLVDLMKKQMSGTITEEELAKLGELLGAAETLTQKISK
jgi:hypothetical protein